MRFTYIILLLLLPAFSYAGGGWTLPKGGAYYKVSQWWVVASKHYTTNGGVNPNPKTGIFNTSLYAEYGITDRLTGIAYFPFLSRNARSEQIALTPGMISVPEESITSLGDTDIGFKYALSKPGSKFAFAGTIQFGIPLGNDAGGSDRSLQTGDGEFNQLIRFDLSRSFSIGKINTYANIYTGFNNRTKDFSDEFRAGGELGANFINGKLWAIVRFDLIESLQNGSSTADNGTGVTVFANNTEYFAYTYELAYYVTQKLGISAATGRVFNASLILAAPSYSVGIFLDLK